MHKFIILFTLFVNNYFTPLHSMQHVHHAQKFLQTHNIAPHEVAAASFLVCYLYSETLLSKLETIIEKEELTQTRLAKERKRLDTIGTVLCYLCRITMLLTVILWYLQRKQPITEPNIYTHKGVSCIILNY